MRGLLIISAVLMMISCGVNPDRMRYHTELYHTSVHLTTPELEEVLCADSVVFGSYDSNIPGKLIGYDTFIARVRTNRGGYSCPLVYKWSKKLNRYVYAFPLVYNTNDVRVMSLEDVERFNNTH